MKSRAVLAFLMIISSCSHKKQPFTWIEGIWKENANQSSGSVLHESWKNENGNFHGFGFDVSSAGDTVIFEELFLQQQNNNWYYRALVPGEHGNDTINFRLVPEENSKRLIFYNYANDFPAIITYELLQNNKLKIGLTGSPATGFQYMEIQMNKVD